MSPGGQDWLPKRTTWKLSLPWDESPLPRHETSWVGGSSLSHPAGLGPAGLGVLEGHSAQGDALAEAGMGRLICMQGPPRREPPPLPLLRGFEQKLRFPSVLVSLSRSEPERGQEQSARPPFNLPAPAGRSRRRGPGEGRAGQLHGLAPGEAGMGPQAQPAQLPLGTPAWWGPLWVPRRLCPLSECLAILVSRPAIRRSAEVRDHGVKGQRSGSLRGQGSVLVQGSVQGQGSLRADCRPHLQTQDRVFDGGLSLFTVVCSPRLEGLPQTPGGSQLSQAQTCP